MFDDTGGMVFRACNHFTRLVHWHPLASHLPEVLELLATAISGGCQVDVRLLVTCSRFHVFSCIFYIYILYCSYLYQFIFFNRNPEGGMKCPYVHCQWSSPKLWWFPHSAASWLSESWTVQSSTMPNFGHSIAGIIMTNTWNVGYFRQARIIVTINQHH